MHFQVAYLQRMTSRWLRVIPALLLFLLFHFQASTSCLCLLFFSGHPELLPLSFPCFRILRVLHRPTHPGTEISTFAEYAYRKACVKENKRQKPAADYICGFTHFPGLLSSLVGVAKCFLFLGRPLPRLVRLRLSSSCSWRSLTQQNNFKRVLVQERRHGGIFRTFVIISRSSDSYSKCASSVKKNLPLVSASLELAELSLLLFIRLLQLSQADTEFHFHCVQHIQRQFTVQLQREATR